MSNAFEITNLEKNFSEFKLGPLDLTLEQGRVLGFIGPNGAGKTTTIHCMVGLMKSDAGTVKIFGRENDPDNIDWKLDIGYVGDEHVFYERWTAERNLQFLSQFYPSWSMEKAVSLAKRFDLVLHKQVNSLSKGNRVKLSLVSALAHAPKLLLFDEPTAGLDPVVRTELLDVLFEAVEGGERSIFYSTHILSDISRLADELVFINEGTLMMRTPKDDLTDNWRTLTFKYEGNLGVIDSVANLKSEGNDHQLISSNAKHSIASLRELGVDNIQESLMSIDEIAVEILRGVKNGKAS